MTTQIRITAQHLAGNDPEDFNVSRWLELLEAEYRVVAAHYYPDAEIEVVIDRQRASGYRRPASASVTVDGVDDYNANLEATVEGTANWLWDKVGGSPDLYRAAPVGR